MPRVPRSQRKRALLAVALSVLLATAGCSGVLDGVTGDSGSSGGAQLASVPADAEVVGYVDASGMLADDSLRSIVTTALETQAEQSEYYTGPTSVEAALSAFENESGLDPSKLGDVTFFETSTEGPAAGTGGTGMVVTSSYSESELVDAMKDESDNWSETTYEDTTLYTYGFEGRNALAVLGDGTFAIGGRAAVESVVDVRAGNERALGGKLKTTFQNTDSGYVRVAMEVPQSQVPTDRYDAGTELNLSAFNTIEYVSLSWTISSGDVVTKTNLVAESSTEAERAYDVIDGALSIYSGVGSEEVQETLEKTSVSRNGDTVTVTYRNSVADVEAMIEELYSVQTTGSASSSTSSSANASATTSAGDA